MHLKSHVQLMLSIEVDVVVGVDGCGEPGRLHRVWGGGQKSWILPFSRWSEIE
jgi:hypothetical protein